MIIDAHAHLCPKPYGSVEHYLSQLDLSGIKQGLVCPGGMVDVRRLGEFTSGRRQADPIPCNDYIQQAVLAHPGLAAVACLDPRLPHAPEALEEWVSRGFRGLLVSPLVHPFSFLDECVAALAALCGERDIPLVSHTGFRPGVTPGDFIQLARRFPRTCFLLEHMGGLQADMDVVDAAASLDNLFLETSLGTFLRLQETVKKTGASKIVFGSEFPMSHPGLELKKICLLPVSEAERDLILGANVQRLFHLH
ncbi:amidohydrolase family protein [Cystobacter ferrugineus]|uniref:Amidohydrolase n=1 Tax=Cystobacter ferrugineus TaxID=83449 RepID=A0A1L9BJS0_9BACT|nr:amidohydrolase family protein [Cystobacter ferrugineus]OJH42520.1 amidohydrolase [Cystobacter ferrugineus]